MLTFSVPAGSPSHGGDVALYVKYINQPSLPTPFYCVLVSISAFMVLSNIFHSIHSPDKSPFSHSVLPVLFLPCWPFSTVYLFMKVSFSPYKILYGWLGLKHQLANRSRPNAKDVTLGDRRVRILTFCASDPANRYSRSRFQNAVLHQRRVLKPKSLISSLAFDVLFSRWWT